MSKGKGKQDVEINDGIHEWGKTRKSNTKTVLKKTEMDKCQVELSTKQHSLFDGIKRNNMTIIHGPAGTSKTFTTCYTALSMLANQKIEKIIISKPIVESGYASLGALPGTMEEKVAPYQSSFISTFEKILDKTTVGFLLSTGTIQFEPLAYMRGSTYDDCIMILDECQNASIKDLMLFSTRMGRNSLVVLLGDTSQYDVKGKYSGFGEFINMASDLNGAFSFKFENADIVRNKFLIALTDAYDKHRANVESKSNVLITSKIKN